MGRNPSAAGELWLMELAVRVMFQALFSEPPLRLLFASRRYFFTVHKLVSSLAIQEMTWRIVV
jgi:hypothetical protein